MAYCSSSRAAAQRSFSAPLHQVSAEVRGCFPGERRPLSRGPLAPGDWIGVTLARRSRLTARGCDHGSPAIYHGPGRDVSSGAGGERCSAGVRKARHPAPSTFWKGIPIPTLPPPGPENRGRRSSSLKTGLSSHLPGRVGSHTLFTGSLAEARDQCVALVPAYSWVSSPGQVCIGGGRRRLHRARPPSETLCSSRLDSGFFWIIPTLNPGLISS